MFQDLTLMPSSAEKATAWIEANAPGTKKGWRWQRNWIGTYAISNREALGERQLEKKTIQPAHQEGRVSQRPS